MIILTENAILIDNSEGVPILVSMEGTNNNLNEVIIAPADISQQSFEKNTEIDISHVGPDAEIIAQTDIGKKSFENNINKKKSFEKSKRDLSQGGTDAVIIAETDMRKKSFDNNMKRAISHISTDPVIIAQTDIKRKSFETNMKRETSHIGADAASFGTMTNEMNAASIENVATRGESAINVVPVRRRPTLLTIYLTCLIPITMVLAFGAIFLALFQLLLPEKLDSILERFRENIAED